MSLTFKEKELVAVSASIASGCKPCTNYHFKKVREAKASDEEIQKAISEAMCVLASAKAIMNSHGLKLLGISEKIQDCGCTENATRIKELVSMGAAFAVNCTSTLKKHIAAANTVGISEQEIKSVLDLSLFIKEKAASHVNRIADGAAKSESSEGCGCENISKVSDKAKENGDCGCNSDFRETDNESKSFKGMFEMMKKCFNNKNGFADCAAMRTDMMGMCCGSKTDNDKADSTCC